MYILIITNLDCRTISFCPSNLFCHKCLRVSKEAGCCQAAAQLASLKSFIHCIGKQSQTQLVANKHYIVYSIGKESDFVGKAGGSSSKEASMNEKKERMIRLASQLYTLGYAVEDARAELQRLSQSDDTAALEDAIRRFQAASERWSAMEEEYLALRDA